MYSKSKNEFDIPARESLLTIMPDSGYDVRGMKPLNIQQIADELAIAWDDGLESYFDLGKLRAACPCASCLGERDLLGNLYKAVTKEGDPEKRKSLVKYNLVGGYALQPVWGDGHDTGLYTFSYLRELAVNAD